MIHLVATAIRILGPEELLRKPVTLKPRKRDSPFPVKVKHPVLCTHIFIIIENELEKVKLAMIFLFTTLAQSCIKKCDLGIN